MSGVALSPFDPETEYRIITSDTQQHVDGYREGEPKYLCCQYCTARVQITPARDDPGIDELPHDPSCPNRFAKTHWWREQFQQT
jgi:hypothetical protein